jgi:hypothetical protein
LEVPSRSLPAQLRLRDILAPPLQIRCTSILKPPKYYWGPIGYSEGNNSVGRWLIHYLPNHPIDYTSEHSTARKLHDRCVEYNDTPTGAGRHGGQPASCQRNAKYFFYWRDPGRCGRLACYCAPHHCTLAHPLPVIASNSGFRRSATSIHATLPSIN